ncbi:MAG TPA: CarD family transcriptional regulator [Acidobacteriota bacterium]
MRFKPGDKVVYPNHGVGEIEEIRCRKIAGAEQDFYHLKIYANQTTVMVPVGNSRTVGLRKLFAKKQILELFAHLCSGDIDIYSNWKGRYKENAEKMRSGHLFDMADVLKNLEHLSKRKALSYREKQMYEKAKYLIISEIAIVEKQTEERVEERIDEALEKAIVARKKRKKSA